MRINRIAHLHTPLLSPSPFRLRNLEDETNVVAHRLGNALVAVMNLCDGCLVETLETSQ